MVRFSPGCSCCDPVSCSNPYPCEACSDSGKDPNENVFAEFSGINQFHQLDYFNGNTYELLPINDGQSFCCVFIYEETVVIDPDPFIGYSEKYTVAANFTDDGLNNPGGNLSVSITTIPNNPFQSQSIVGAVFKTAASSMACSSMDYDGWDFDENSWNLQDPFGFWPPTGSEYARTYV